MDYYISDLHLFLKNPIRFDEHLFKIRNDSLNQQIIILQSNYNKQKSILHPLLKSYRYTVDFESSLHPPN